MNSNYPIKKSEMAMYIEYADNTSMFLYPSDNPPIFMHIDGTVIIGQTIDVKKIDRIIPFALTGYKDINGQAILDHDVITFKKDDVDTNGVVFWIDDGFFVVTEQDEKIRLSHVEQVTRVGHYGGSVEQKVEEVSK